MKKGEKVTQLFVGGCVQSETAQPEDALVISYEIAKFDRLQATAHGHYRHGFLGPGRSAGDQQSPVFAEQQHTGKQQMMGLVPCRTTARPSSLFEGR